MTDRLALAGTTIQDIAHASPAAAAALRELGIDACCGGALTLEQAAAARGLPLAAVISALAVPLATPGIRASDNIRDVLARHPGTYAVFAAHGLMGCGGATGPDEPIDLFARVHEIDAGRLTVELNAAAAGEAPAPAAPTAACGPTPPPAGGRLPVITLPSAGAAAGLRAGRAERPERPVFAPFLRAALWCTLTLGASFGALNLLSIDFSLGPVLEAHNFVHAGFQIWGFVLLFTMGVSYHALPRFLGADLGRPRAARLTLWLALVGLLLQTYGRFAHWLPASVPVFAAGALLTFCATAGWAYLLLDVRERSRSPVAPFHRFLAAGTAWWLVAAGLLLAGAVRAIAHGGVEFAARYNEALYTAALLGGTLAWIQGVYLRTGPAFFGLPGTRPAAIRASFVLGLLGAASASAGSLVPAAHAAHVAVSVGLVLSALSAVAYVAGVRPFAVSRDLPAGDRRLGGLVSLGFAGLLVFATVAASHGLASLLGATPSRLVFDAARHAFVLGFVTVVILAMAGRIVPVFCGAQLVRPRAHAGGVRLVALAMLLRQTQILAALLAAPRLLWVTGLSGPLAAIGVALAATSILGTLRAARRAQAAAPAATKSASAVPIAAGTNVAELVAAHEESLPLLIACGFTPLANPVLRLTLARAVTLGQACRMHGVEVEPLLARLRDACAASPHGRSASHAA